MRVRFCRGRDVDDRQFFRWFVTGVGLSVRMVSEMAVQARLCVRQGFDIIYVVVGRRFDV